MTIIIENLIVSFNSSLKESVERIISINDAPDWVKNLVGSSFRTIKLVIDPSPTIPGQWHDYNSTTLYGYNGRDITKVHSANYDSLINATEKEKLAYQGGKINLNPKGGPGQTQMILVTDTYPKRATLYAHPDNIAPDKLEGPKQELSEEEEIVLYITKVYLPAYRKEYLRRAKIQNLDAIKQSLLQKGLLNGQGALTLKGKDYMVQFMADIEKKYSGRIGRF